MFNSLLFLAWTIAGLAALVLIFRSFGKIGLVGFIGAAVVIMNILVTKGMIIFGVGATGGTCSSRRSSWLRTCLRSTSEAGKREER